MEIHAIVPDVQSILQSRVAVAVVKKMRRCAEKKVLVGRAGRNVASHLGPQRLLPNSTSRPIISASRAGAEHRGGGVFATQNWPTSGAKSERLMGAGTCRIRRSGPGVRVVPGTSDPIFIAEPLTAPDASTRTVSNVSKRRERESNGFRYRTTVLFVTTVKSS